ncbi:MAG TPA: ATP-dependent Clp protease adapter ClpS [Vicinamibacterales bacterium]
MPDSRPQFGEEVLERTHQETREPPLYKVILLNDDYTTMEFVVQILETVFHKSPAEAFRVMMQVHTQGKGLCGLYPFDIAETKVATVHELAREHGFPLRADMEAA